jgi:leucyl aminopeptidase
MQFSFGSSAIHEVESDSLVLFVPVDDHPLDKRMKALDAATNGAVTIMAESGEFVGREGQIVSLPTPAGFRAGRAILVGLGDADDVNADSYRRAAGRLSRWPGFTSYQNAAFHLGDLDDAGCFQAIIEGYILGSHRMLQYKTDDAGKATNKLTAMAFVASHGRLKRRLEKAVLRGQIAAEAQTQVRELATAPANMLTPRLFAAKALKLARAHGIKARALDSKGIAQEKMGALMAVAKGSSESPRFVILEYNAGRKGQKPIVLVGKGITFDSGGLSLKKADLMHEMKGDMAGAAVVLSTIVAAARAGLKLNIVALMPLAENMPSAKATRPGDIVTARNGMTIEIINTDAEGRLILADALDFANEFDPQAVIDIATLTGASLYILGYSGAPILGNNQSLENMLREAADVTAERVWPLPLWDDFRLAMKSDLADLANSGGKAAGTATAAAFLENFIGDWPWAHVDIAYVDVELKGRPYIPRGTTGIGARLLLQVLTDWRKPQ